MPPERLSRTVVYESPWVNLYLDAVRFPNGRVIERHHLLDFDRETVVAAVEDQDGRLLFVRVPRYTTGRAEWELPAGWGERGESPLEAAVREVREETGYSVEDARLVYSFYPLTGIANHHSHVIRCRAGQLAGDWDASEISEVAWFTRDEVRRMLQAGEFSDGFTVLALMMVFSDIELGR